MSSQTIEIMNGRFTELVYSGVQIEGIAATFAETEQVIKQGKAKGISAGDVTKIIGIKRALEYLFENYEEPITFELYSRYNSIVGDGSIENAGLMRGPGEVRVDDYVPGDVDVDRFNSIVETSLQCSYDHREAACCLVLNLAKAQFFYDGNKRTSSILANHLLAQRDSGAAFIVRECDRDAYLDLLVGYYHGILSIQDASWDLEALAIQSDRKLSHAWVDETGFQGGRPSQAPAACDKLSSSRDCWRGVDVCEKSEVSARPIPYASRTVTTRRKRK